MIKKPRLLPVFLENSGLLVNELHYGPYSQFWWDFSTENNVVNFPIRLNQQVKVFLNGNDFFLTVKKGAGNLPEYHCKSGEITGQNSPFRPNFKLTNVGRKLV
ncbi:unnamed protein product [Rhizophagus irregularis]|nr:unnamed protein product [Rhizophagus irregularis]